MADKEYIEREALIDCLRKERSEIEIWEDDDKAFNLGVHQGYVFAIHDAESIPAADVRPVVRGRWKDETGFIFSDLSQQVRCSKCGLIAYFYDKMPMNFCPNCGAMMEES